MTGKIFKIAFNNVTKQKRRSGFNGLTFAANMFALVALLGLIRGQYNAMFDRMIELKTGHFKIYAKGYIEEKKRMPLDINIADPEEVIKDLRTISNVKAAVPRIIAPGVVSNMTRKTNVMITGVDFERDKKATVAYSRTEGWLPERGTSGIVAGKRLQELLKLEPGQQVLIFGQTRLKANNLMDAQVTGIYSAGFQLMEKTVVFADYGFVSDFLDMGGAATEIMVVIDRRENVPFVKEKIKRILDEKYPQLIVRDWAEEEEGMIFAVQQDMIFYGFIFAILLFLAVFIIINTLTISVYERTAEIGTLRAIGAEKSMVRGIFFTEGMMLSLLGVVIGGVLVLPLVYYLNVHGITLPPESLKDLPIPFEPVMKARNHGIDWLISGLICMAAGAVGALWPSNKAAQTNIVAALKRGVR